MRKTKDAFIWIIDILRKNRIPFCITGGFAARIYGSNRLLADIDIEIHEKDIMQIEKEVKDFIIYGPKRYIDKEFDLLLMTLKYKGQAIDICGVDTQKLFNKKTKKWDFENQSLSRVVKKKVYNHVVPVIPLKDLLSYKKKISREVDIRDVSDLT
jgi:hypothetical protein